jgi:hypothetical protein
MTAYFSSSLSARCFRLFLLPASTVLVAALPTFRIFTPPNVSISFLNAIFFDDAHSCNFIRRNVSICPRQANSAERTSNFSLGMSVFEGKADIAFPQSGDARQFL